MHLNFFKKFFVCLFLILVLTTLCIPFSNANQITTPTIDCPTALLMDFNTGKILYEKNIYQKMYPASLTKVMTAIIVLEKCNLLDIATVSYNSIMSIESGYVVANLQVGEELTIEQLLYLLMVGSCNDAAIVLAEHISGSVENFSVLMNEKAKKLGCTSTNFVNPNGVHDESHYSTAYDLALIAKYAMQNETFKNIVATTYYELPTTNKYDKTDRIFITTNDLLRGDYYYKYATGIKTGFTSPAKNCLIASATKNNLELITVVLGGEQRPDGSSQRYLDTINLFEYGYLAYSLKEIVKSGDIVQTTNVKNATRDTKKLDVAVAENINVTISKDLESSTLLPEIKFNDNLKAPINKGDIIGTVTYTAEGVNYTENLVASHDVEKSYAFITFAILILILFFFLLFSKTKNMKKKNKKKKLKNRIR